MTPKVRFWLYYSVGLLLFSALFWAQQYLYYVVGAYALLVIWVVFFDRVRRDGGETLLGWPREKVTPYVRSMFGKRTED